MMVRDSISVLNLCTIAHILYSLLILSNEVLRIFQFITKYIAISLLKLSNSRKTIVVSLLEPVIVFLNVSKIYVGLLYVRRVLLIETGTILCITISLLRKRNLLLTPSKSFLTSVISTVCKQTKLCSQLSCSRDNRTISNSIKTVQSRLS